MTSRTPDDLRSALTAVLPSVREDLEPGKSVEGSTWTGRVEAEAEIQASYDRFKSNGGY